jgi:electron transfer flavoprotein alpha subunit
MTCKVLIVAEHNGSVLSAVTSKCIRATENLDGARVSVVVFADDGEAVAKQASELASIERVILVQHALHCDPVAALIAPQLAELAAEFSHILGPSTTFGRDLIPRVAAILGTAQISDVMEIKSATRFRRPIYAGNAIATVEVSSEPIVATIRVSSYRETGTQSPGAPIELATPQTPLPSHTRFVEISQANSSRPDLQTAGRVITGGRGMASPEGFGKLDRLADLLGAAIGATRAAVDSGFAPNELQVGQTGKIIAPELYIAFGVSGAIQHLAGIKDARTIVAVNKDADAPIFEIADIGLVADLFTVLPELERILESEA